MKTSEDILFALLRASIHEKETETSFFKNVSDKHWETCFQLAQSQGVMALAWDGILHLPTHLHPPVEIKIPWGIKVEVQERKHLRHCKAIQEISSFFQKHHIQTMTLKGIGLSTLYPIPSHREGGDIDIYTYSANETMSDKEVNLLADTLMEQQGLEIDVKKTPKHSLFYYKGIPVENHRTFTNVHSYKIANQIEALLKKHMNPQIASLPTGEIFIPSPKFNTLFVFFHTMQHYGSGLSLHHLCDWAIILKNYGMHFPEELTDKRLLKAASALTSLCNHLLGTSIEIEEEKKFADVILKEMLHTRYYKHPLPQSKIKAFVFKIKRFVYNQKLKKSIFNHSLWKSFFFSVVYHVAHPKKIFN